MTNTRLLLGAGLFTLGLFACAGDPNKQANDAHDGELKSERKQIENTADDRSATRVTAGEGQRNESEANATKERERMADEDSAPFRRCRTP